MVHWSTMLWLGILVAIFAVVLGAKLEHDCFQKKWSSLVDGEMSLVYCYPAGCSLLVDRRDGSSDWVWVPRVEPAQKAEKE